MLRELTTTVVLVVYVCVVHTLVLDIPGLGRIKGTSTKSAWTTRIIYEYKGIHYAQTTSGQNRFKEAVKVLPWQGVKNATSYGQPCPQPGVSSHSKDPEDCLSLDVYTPTAKESAKLPVLVFFHGGGFIAGSSVSHRPDFLLEKDIVLVTPQYRIGALGFFQLKSAEAPGNVGLADQIMALQWVKDNIAAFGGDPTRVTISGSSAGAASVSLHMISSRSKGLFQQVIAMSGSALALWALEENHGESHSRRVAALAGCDSKAPADQLVKCMRNLPSNETVRAVVMHSLMERRVAHMGMGVSQPSMQHKVEGIIPFLSATPRKILESGNYKPVPLMMGVTKHEGIFTLDLSYQYYLVPNRLVENHAYLRNDMISMMLEQYEIQDNSRVIAKAVRKQYFSERMMGNFTAMIPSLVDFSGVTLIRGPSIRQTEIHSGLADTYFYSFDYYGAQTLLRSSNSTIPIKNGISHGDDTLYLFPRAKHPLNEADTRIAKRMVHLFSNFITYGDPTSSKSPVLDVPRWPKYDTKYETWMSLGENANLHSDYRQTFTDARDNGIENRPRDLVAAVLKELSYRIMG